MSERVKVVIHVSHGLFEPNEEFTELLERLQLNWYDIKARTNPEVIDYVEKHSNEYGISFVGTEYWTYLRVVEVDTGKPWTIGDYDGAEGIHYLEYRVVDANINYWTSI